MANIILDGYPYYLLFENTDSNYRIYKLSLEDKREVTIFGYIPKLSKTVSYHFECLEKRHPKFGLQYEILTYKENLVKNKEGIINYLSSPLFMGIGKKSATLIYETLGDDALRLITDNPEILDNIKLTKKQKDVILLNLLQNSERENVFYNLYKLDLTTKMVMKLYEKYGFLAYEIISENPYHLSEELEGFGFKKCDTIAYRLGFKEDNPLRIRALFIYILTNTSNQQGHIYLTKEQLFEYSYAYFENGITTINLTSYLLLLIKEGKIIEEENRLYLPYLYQAEMVVAKKLLSLNSSTDLELDILMVENILIDVAKENALLYSSAQKEAIIEALRNKICLITGGPGTGKTTLIKAIIEVYAKINDFSINDKISKEKILLVAPTGKAAKRISEKTSFMAQTIHKALGYNFDGKFFYDENNKLGCELLIIDEFSMVDLMLSKHLFSAIKDKTKIIILGDADQIPSISPGNMLSDLINADIFSHLRLKEIFRQSHGSKIIELSQMVLNNKIDSTIFDSDEVIYKECLIDDIDDQIISVIKEYQNQGYRLEDEIQVLAPIYRGGSGIDHINQIISKNFNPNPKFSVLFGENIFKESDKVIQLINSKELHLMNGDIGIIKEEQKNADKTSYKIYFDEEVIFQKEDFQSLSLAYALSIHKAQGSEYPVVILPMFSSFYPMLKQKLIYTAISRAKKHLIIVGDLNTLYSGIRKKEALRQTTLVNRLNKDSIKSSEYEIFEDETLSPYDFLE